MPSTMTWNSTRTWGRVRFSFGVLLNDAVPPGYSITAVTQGTLGDVSIEPGGGDVLYAPHANANGSDTFTYTLSDGFGSEDTATVSLDLVSVNDEPAGTNAAIGVTKNSSHTFTTGDFGFNDPNDSPADDLLAVKVTTLPGAGTLTDDGSAVTAGDLVSAGHITGGKLVYTPVGGATGSPYATFTFQVQDDGGTAGGGVDLDASANTITINVTPTNHAPSGANKTITSPEDVVYTLVAGDFGFTDPNDAPANTLLAVKVATLATAGTLKDNNVAVTLGQVIPVADITGNKLTFTPAANQSGGSYASFTFQVQDNGGTANGGVDLDSSANTITFNVTARNDAPDGANKAVTIAEEVSYTFVAADFGFSDVNDSPANALTAVRITTLPAVGSMKDNGVAVTAGASVPVADITASKLVYTPVLNGNGSPYTSFRFQVQDNGGTGNGGVDLDQAANTIAINVTPVQDPPDARTDASFTVPENAGPTALAVLANDVEVDGETMSITGVTQPAHGVVAITGSGTGLTYDPTQLYSGTDSFTYTISDGHGGSDTATVLLTVVKDATAPTVVGPAEAFYAQTVANATMNARRSPGRAAMPATGIKKYELAVSVNGGVVHQPDPRLGHRHLARHHPDRREELPVPGPGHRQRGQRQRLGQRPGVQARPDPAEQHQRGVRRTVGDRVHGLVALGGSHRFASSLSARAALTRTTRDFALVMTKTLDQRHGRGPHRRRPGGDHRPLTSTRRSYRQLVYSKHFGTLGTHTIEVRPIGGTRIYLDAFLVMR